MDPTKPSLSSKSQLAQSGGGNESMADGSMLQQDSVDGERQRDSDGKEADVVDGTTAAAEITAHHRGSADKHKFNTLGYQRRTKQKVVTNFATVSKGTSAVAKPRAALKQVLFNQGVSDKNPASEERGQQDLLKQCLEAFAVPVSLEWKWKEKSQGTTLEKNWTDIVQSHSTMSKTQRHQQEALWEFVHTELTYINRLIIITDLVIAALDNLHQHGFLLEVTPELLFSNLPSILSEHQLFWQEVIYPMLHEVRRTREPFDPMRLEAGCLQFHKRFSSYKDYCWEEENNLEFTRRQMANNPHFHIYVQWVETHPQCERMRLGDMQAKPHQRITKYPLLLKAVLRSTQDPPVQQALRGMLSSVNCFLESINDYLKLKDEELALSISAQRVEGYEVEGLNEEIDKYVKEICQFDLTCLISGVGPEVVRKLLLEENLKIRGRKDSKLEVVALLFSDVLLMTKVQKKGERLKVVRPPLALDRMHCMALKDGCSFVLVEVGELRSTMNVYIFVASTSDSCSTWVSTILKAKVTLRSQRQAERKRQMENWKIQLLEARPDTDVETDDVESEQLPTQSDEETFPDEPSDELISPQSVNGTLESKEAEEQYLSPDDSGSPSWGSQHINNKHKPVPKKFAGRQPVVRGHEWIEMGLRGDQAENHIEEDEKIIESEITDQLWLTSDRRGSNLDSSIPSTSGDSLIYNTAEPNAHLLGGLPDVDYPTDEDCTSQLSYQHAISWEGPEFQRPPGDGAIPIRRNSDFQSMDQDTSRNSSYSDSDDMGTESWGFIKKLKSPGLQRKRPLNTLQAPLTQKFKQESEETFAGSKNNSSSNYGSDDKLNNKRNSISSGQSADSHRVLKLGSLKPNQGMFWNMNHKVAQDPQMFKPVMSDQDFNSKRTKPNPPRSTSMPNISEGGHALPLLSSRLYTLPQEQDMSGHTLNGQPSPLEGLLERAKERVRERDELKRDKDLKMDSVSSRCPPSPSISTALSPSPSDGDRDTEFSEKEVELTRHRASTVSEGWKEQLVDEEDDEKRNSVVFMDGVNVDWTGWCFDDDEIMDHMHPGSEGLLEGITASLPYLDLHGVPEHEDGECSQV